MEDEPPACGRTNYVWIPIDLWRRYQFEFAGIRYHGGYWGHIMLEMMALDPVTPIYNVRNLIQ